MAAGLGKGLIGTVTKPIAGVLDFASGAANFVRHESERTSHKSPDRLRLPRCCHGPGGLLPTYSAAQADAQQLMHKISKSTTEQT